METEHYRLIRNLANQSNGLHYPEEQDQSWHDHFIAINKDLCYVAMRDGALVGFVYVGYDGRRATIYHLYVIDICRSLGVGEDLMVSAEEVIAKLLIPRARLMVLRENVHAKTFFLKRGWQMSDDWLLFKAP